MEKEYNVLGITFKDLNSLSIYLENFNNQSGLKRIDEDDKVIYVKGHNDSRYQREYESVPNLETHILTDMRDQEKKVYIKFPSMPRIGIIFPEMIIEQTNNFDPYPNISKTLGLNADSVVEYLKRSEKIENLKKRINQKYENSLS